MACTTTMPKNAFPYIKHRPHNNTSILCCRDCECDRHCAGDCDGNGGDCTVQVQTPTPTPTPPATFTPLRTPIITILPTKVVSARSIWSQESHDTRYIPEDRSLLDFDDFDNNPLRYAPQDREEEEAQIPNVEDIVAQEELFQAVRRLVDSNMARTHTATSTSQLTPSEMKPLCEHTGIRIASGDISTNDKKLSPVEKAQSGEATMEAAKAHKLKESEWETATSQSLVEQGIYLDLEAFGTQQRIEAAQRDLEHTYPDNEAQFRNLFWEEFFFQNTNRLWVDDHHGLQRVVQINEQRIQTVAVTTASIPKPIPAKEHRSKAIQLCPEGALTYYPLQLLLPAQNSLLPNALPKLELKLANAYIWIDIGYVVEAEDTWKMFTDDDEERFRRLPVNRLFWKTDLNGKRRSKFHYLNHLLIEVKPLESSSSSHTLMDKAVGYLVLNAAACLHDYMKLLWLGAPLSATEFKADHLPVIYLIAAVGFKARVFCMHIRRWNRNQSSTRIRYEAVEMGTYDLKDKARRDHFRLLYNSIQALAQHYAACRKQAIIKAMQSKRDVATTELPDLSFVQSKEGYFQMFDKDGTVQYEGPQMEVQGEEGETEKQYLYFDEEICGELPKEDSEDLEDPIVVEQDKSKQGSGEGLVSPLQVTEPRPRRSNCIALKAPRIEGKVEEKQKRSRTRKKRENN